MVTVHKPKATGGLGLLCYKPRRRAVREGMVTVPPDNPCEIDPHLGRVGYAMLPPVLSDSLVCRLVHRGGELAAVPGAARRQPSGRRQAAPDLERTKEH